jgi:hypothetical protein
MSTKLGKQPHLNKVTLIQINRQRTSFVHPSSSWNRVEKEGRKLRYRVKKEEEEKRVYLPARIRNLTKRPGSQHYLPEKIMIVILIPFNNFPTAKGLLIGL